MMGLSSLLDVLEEGSGTTLGQDVDAAFDSISYGSTVGVDCTGAFAAIGARKGLYLVDLDLPYQPCKVLTHHSRWDVSAVAWNAVHSHRNVLASTSDQNALVWDLESSGRALLAKLRVSERHRQHHPARCSG
eukprot:PLAT2851.1.p1 GENE.PLAT2851.1~~PLAT2851.1.p1  ORF type:complete len:132 (-),score=44.82 PLAT2851.1:105-500(-)